MEVWKNKYQEIYLVSKLMKGCENYRKNRNENNMERIFQMDSEGLKGRKKYTSFQLLARMESELWLSSAGAAGIDSYFVRNVFG